MWGQTFCWLQGGGAKKFFWVDQEGGVPSLFVKGGVPTLKGGGAKFFYVGKRGVKIVSCTQSRGPGGGAKIYDCLSQTDGSPPLPVKNDSSFILHCFAQVVTSPDSSDVTKSETFESGFYS